MLGSEFKFVLSCFGDFTTICSFNLVKLKLILFSLLLDIAEYLDKYAAVITITLISKHT